MRHFESRGPTRHVPDDFHGRPYDGQQYPRDGQQQQRATPAFHHVEESSPRSRALVLVAGGSEIDGAPRSRGLGASIGQAV